MSENPKSRMHYVWPWLGIAAAAALLFWLIGD